MLLGIVKLEQNNVGIFTKLLINHEHQLTCLVGNSDNGNNTLGNHIKSE